MQRIIMLIPISAHVGLTGIILGFVKIIKEQNLKIGFFKPVIKSFNKNKYFDHKTTSILKNLLIDCIEPIKLDYEYNFNNYDQIEALIDKIVERCYMDNKYDIIIIEGFRAIEMGSLSNILNYKIALALQTEIILVALENKNFNSYILENTYLMKQFFNTYNNVLGIIVNKVNMVVKNKTNFFLDAHHDILDHTQLLFNNSIFPILAVIPYNIELINILVTDIFIYLNADIFYKGKKYTCETYGYVVYDKNFVSMIDNIYNNFILIISIDQLNVLDKYLLNKIVKSKIVAILLTDMNQYYNLAVLSIFIDKDISIFSVKENTLETLLKLYNVKFQIKINDIIGIKKLQNYITQYLGKKILSILYPRIHMKINLSSSIFRMNLVKLAIKNKRRIILPEGHDPRILRAASICTRKGIADCIVLGDQNRINNIVVQESIILQKDIIIINPIEIRNKYITRLMKLRKHKGMTIKYAQELIKNNIILATLMLEKGEVDGLVSGIINTTANTIRPALQLIKKKKDVDLVSSLFFMLLSNQVLVYADCAINIEPTASQLAEIAIQSADSAKLFGISPRIAMISYSTKNSGFGPSVDRVREATHIVRIKRPDLIIDGPLQYDTATVPSIAIEKSPNSCIIGNANIFIFPNLNTGNTIYKAVQRSSANIIAIGPILQGLKKPVNDLSRGAMIDDIVYTIAITAIQSQIKNI